MSDQEKSKYTDQHSGKKASSSKKVILKCGRSPGTVELCHEGPQVNGLAPNGAEWRDHSDVIATVVLDTSKLIDPTIKIDLSSLISFKTCGDDNYSLKLVFKLSKICDGCPIPLGTWTFEKSQFDVLIHGAAPPNGSGQFVQETDSFSFSWCTCEDCPDCCHYLVEVIDQQCFNIEYVAISNISLTALAVGTKKSRRC